MRGPVLMIPTVAPEPPGRPDRSSRGVSLPLVGILCLGGGVRAHPPGVDPGSERESYTRSSAFDRTCLASMTAL